MSRTRAAPTRELGLPDAISPGALPKGLNVNSVALTPDHRLLITYGGANALALVTPMATSEVRPGNRVRK